MRAPFDNLKLLGRMANALNLPPPTFYHHTTIDRDRAATLYTLVSQALFRQWVHWRKGSFRRIRPHL